MSDEKLPPLAALRAFEAAARLASFARASEELDVTPGAISQQVRLLEDYAGQPLFRRLGRRVELTDPARAALPQLIEAFERLRDAARLLRQPLRRKRIAISCAPSFAAKWLAGRLERFQLAHPDIEVWLSADMTVVDLSVADIDLAIRYGPGGYPGASSERFLSETVTPVCGPDMAAALAQPSDLASAALIHDDSAELDPSCPDWPSWLAARGLQHADPRRGLRFNQTSLVIEAAASGRGVALAKRHIAQADIDAGRLVVPFGGDDTPVNFAYWLVRPKGRSMTPALQAFLSWLKAEAHVDDYAI